VPKTAIIPHLGVFVLIVKHRETVIARPIIFLSFTGRQFIRKMKEKCSTKFQFKAIAFGISEKFLKNTVPDSCFKLFFFVFFYPDSTIGQL
jgi:hypothetical protein